MNYNFTKYLEALKQHNQKAVDAQKTIDIKTEEYKKSIAREEKIIENSHSEIEAIRKMEIYAELKDVINEIAKEWQITPDKITTNCFVCFVHEPEKHEVYPGVKDLKGYYILNFSLFAKQGGLRFAGFSLKTDVNEPQLDGCPLSKYLHSATRTKNGNPKTLTDNDIANMVVKLKISDITQYDGQPKESECGTALFKACELYNKKHSNQTM